MPQLQAGDYYEGGDGYAEEGQQYDENYAEEGGYDETQYYDAGANAASNDPAGASRGGGGVASWFKGRKQQQQDIEW